MLEALMGKIKDRTERNFSITDIPLVASDLLEKLRKQKKEKVSKAKKEAMVVLLNGDLGAGKTTLAKEIAKALGVEDTVISPTFVIKKIYKTNDADFKYLIHVDAYRLEGEKEGRVLELNYDLKNEDALILIEWADKINWKSKDAVVEMNVVSESERSINIKYAN